MSKILFITSNTVLFNTLCIKLSLDSITPLLYSNKDYSALLSENNKIDATLLTTQYLYTEDLKPSKIIVINPVQCPDTNINKGSIIIGSSVTEWDKPVISTHNLSLESIEVEDRVIVGKVMSGDRDCINKTTPIMQSKMIDTITYPISHVCQYFSIPIISIGIVADYCTQNYSKILQASIEELSDRLVSFIHSNIIGG